MKVLFVVSLLLLLIVIVALVASKKGELLSAVKRSWPFYAKRLMSEPEQVLYHRLAKALSEHIVLAQVQVSRVLGIKKGFNFHEWNNRINRLSYDFVVCAKDSTPLAAIELVDCNNRFGSAVHPQPPYERMSAVTTDSRVTGH